MQFLLNTRSVVCCGKGCGGLCHAVTAKCVRWSVKKNIKELTIMFDIWYAWHSTAYDFATIPNIPLPRT